MDFETLFFAYESEVKGLGFDGVLYAHIPKAVLELNFIVDPVFKISSKYDKTYYVHYFQARYFEHDPILNAVLDGVTSPIDWWGEISEAYKRKSLLSCRVISEARSYGIQNGFTIPLKTGRSGISFVSIFSKAGVAYEQLIHDKLSELMVSSRVFHLTVMSNMNYLEEFTRPLMEVLDDDERRYLADLALGKSTRQIAHSLCTTTNHLEQSMIQISRKLSSVGPLDPPTLNHDQVLYYAGLMNVLEYVELHQKH